MEWTEPGTFEVAPGVHRIPLPLPNDGLHTVNVYAIEDGDGLVLVDAGWALEDGERALEAALGALGRDFGDIRRFLVTHLHRDHYTLAVALRRRFGTRVALGLGEQPSLRRILSRTRDGQLSNLLSWGGGELAARWRKAVEAVGEAELRDYEEPDEWLTETDLGLEKRVLRVLPTPGHTRGHVVFVDVESSLLFAGDHVLPHITPSIGFEPARPELPLGDYLDSLRLVRSYPDLRLLPAHGPVTESSHARVDELLAHHEQRLEATLDAVRSGTGTAFETARKLGWTRRDRRFDDLDLFNRVLATGETAAHLDVLVRRGLVAVAVVDGVDVYSAR
ncbi:MBL fold metallo-hydrolase [Saccharothrix variisporea]|uniref:Glyoxylase-like metal-dependent hydrolase (Beta-lactamase superfamily II) n=1 Tax=Saccharothrix variisporea TaxID=543527 RepID=A0A495XI50_9PSEU|nr:MBL fold metallo-hydrolase [Saccharothrix variisporea]RKT74040.1 glyoxylase-like metal-dependent hydrolase (beta-lactamase superfamily II) [Saccharothrix variisporea]